jgi:hypothetical protein
MGRRRILLVTAATTALAALAVALVAAYDSGSDGGEGVGDAVVDDELQAKTDEINRTAPSAGLGEAAPPPPDSLTSGWTTDFSRHSVPLEEIRSGGPPKDGIPAIDEPAFETALDVDWLRDPEPVIAVTVDGVTRGYPIQILMWHEIVNDVVQGRPIAVTFCPLCNTAIVFDRRLDGAVLDFGTTGNLRNSDLVMYDRQTESWWQQFSGEAIVGEHTGRRLDQLAARIVAWSAFRTAHPESDVLSRDTGVARDYGRNPYVGYDDVDSPPFFPAAGDDDRFAPKERVVYVEVGDDAIAVPFEALATTPTITATVGGEDVVVRWAGGVASALDGGTVADGRDVGSATVTVAGEPAPFHEPFWFAVAAFRPDVRIVRR